MSIEQEPSETADLNSWYSRTKEFWEHSEPTVFGMLGGLPETAQPDEECSLKYLQALYQQNNYPMVGTRALDVGAGIGRITRQVLVNIFQQVDFQDQNSTFISQGLGEMSSLVEAGRVRQGIVHPLQTLTPPNKEYDCIWIQWVIGYLPKEELIATLNRLRPSLRKNGYLIIKENCDDELYHDDGDNYLIRKVDDWVNIFNESDFQVISHEEDRLLPKTIKPVFFFLLKPKDEFKAEDMRGPLLPKRRRKAL